MDAKLTLAQKLTNAEDGIYKGIARLWFYVGPFAGFALAHYFLRTQDMNEWLRGVLSALIGLVAFTVSLLFFMGAVDNLVSFPFRIIRKCLGLGPRWQE